MVEYKEYHIKVVKTVQQNIYAIFLLRCSNNTNYSEIIRKWKLFVPRANSSFMKQNKMFHYSGTILHLQNCFKKKYLELMMKKKPALL